MERSQWSMRRDPGLLLPSWTTLVRVTTLEFLISLISASTALSAEGDVVLSEIDTQEVPSARAAEVQESDDLSSLPTQGTVF